MTGSRSFQRTQHEGPSLGHRRVHRFAVARVLLARGDTVVSFENLNDYYDVTLTQVRLAHFIDHPNYVHVQADLEGRAAVEQVFVTQTQSARST